MYTLESLKEINRSYNYQHWMNEDDVKKANTWVEFIESTRDDKFPQVGDIIEFTNKHGDYYKNAHIEKVSDKELEICEQPHIPFIGTYNGKFYTSTSGGSWCSVPTNLKLIGKRKKYFGDWGHCGACANGQMIFSAMVNVWEYKEPESLYGDFTTKEFDKFYVSILEDEKLKEQHNNYKYLVTTSGCMSHTAFKTDKQYQAWLKTFNGVEFAGHWENQRIVWTHKQIKERVSLEEYNSIDGIIDTTLEFQSTRPHGARQVIKTIFEERTEFQSTRPHGARRPAAQIMPGNL
jgi:hypothetical protein